MQKHLSVFAKESYTHIFLYTFLSFMVLMCSSGLDKTSENPFGLVFLTGKYDLCVSSRVFLTHKSRMRAEVLYCSVYENSLVTSLQTRESSMFLYGVCAGSVYIQPSSAWISNHFGLLPMHLNRSSLGFYVRMWNKHQWIWKRTVFMLFVFAIDFLFLFSQKILSKFKVVHQILVIKIHLNVLLYSQHHI